MITAGQQVRPQITMEANLTNRDATIGPQPYVKWSHEPPRAQDVPAAHRPRDPPRHRCRPAARRSSRSRWTTGTRGRRRPRSRTPSRAASIGRAAPDPEAALAALAERLAGAASPVLVAGPDIDAAGGWEHAVALAEKQRLPVWATPGHRRRLALGFPERHPNFVGRAAAGDRPGRPRRSRPTTCRWSSAPRCSPTTPTSRGRCWPRAPRWWRSPAIPARRPGRRWATRSSATSALALERAGGAASPDVRARRRPTRGPTPGEPPRRRRPDAQRLAGDGGAGGRRGRRTASPSLESPSSTLSLRNRLRISPPGSYYFCASGGLGFGISAAVGVQLAQPDAARSSACWARARRSTGSPRCGRRSPTRCPSPSSCCATRST